MSARQLPPQSNLRQLKSQAKDLRKAAAARDATALTRIRSHHPRHADSTDDELALSLQEAQLVIAREYGYDSWPRLSEALESASAVTAGVDALLGDALVVQRGQLQRAAATGVHTLLVGAAGTGKRLAASVLHELRGGPIAHVHCDALPDTLSEAELFGYEVGAFTGAHVATAGRLEEAQGGTVVLHEVSRLSPAAQMRLLEAMESGSYRRLGGSEGYPFDVQLICLASDEPQSGSGEGQIRQDLYFRLQVLRIDLPSLAERQQDIAALAVQFAAQAPRADADPEPALSDEALALLSAAEWPGNVRQLRHVVEAAALSTPDGQIEAAHIRIH